MDLLATSTNEVGVDCTCSKGDVSGEGDPCGEVSGMSSEEGWRLQFDWRPPQSEGRTNPEPTSSPWVIQFEATL
jgi:hypothetical protein